MRSFIPGRIVHGPRSAFARRLFRNRYDPASRWVSLQDVWMNFREVVYCWSHRVPPGATLHWKDGKIISFETRRD